MVSSPYLIRTSLPSLSRRRKRDTEGFGEESREPTTGNGGDPGTAERGLGTASLHP